MARIATAPRCSTTARSCSSPVGSTMRSVRTLRNGLSQRRVDAATGQACGRSARSGGASAPGRLGWSTGPCWGPVSGTGQPQLALPCQGRTDQAGEQRVRARRAGAQFRMRLRRDVIRVDLARQLDELDQVRVRRRSAEDHACLLKLRAVAVVDLVAVAVPLLDLVQAIGLRD